jgi:hypothetical protein
MFLLDGLELTANPRRHILEDNTLSSFQLFLSSASKETHVLMHYGSFSSDETDGRQLFPNYVHLRDYLFLFT